MHESRDSTRWPSAWRWHGPAPHGCAAQVAAPTPDEPTPTHGAAEESLLPDEAVEALLRAWGSTGRRSRAIAETAFAGAAELAEERALAGECGLGEKTDHARESAFAKQIARGPTGDGASRLRERTRFAAAVLLACALVAGPGAESGHNTRSVDSCTAIGGPDDAGKGPPQTTPIKEVRHAHDAAAHAGVRAR